MSEEPTVTNLETACLHLVHVDIEEDNMLDNMPKCWNDLVASVEYIFCWSKAYLYVVLIAY